MKRSRVLIVVIGLILAVAAMAAVYVVRQREHRPEVNSASTTSSEELRTAIGFIVQKPSELIEAEVTEAQKAEGDLWRLIGGQGSESEFVIDANYQQGEALKKLSNYTKLPLRDAMVKNINLQLPVQYSDYKEITQRNLEINGFQASETVFEYQSKGQTVQQRLVVFAKNSDTAVYVRAQAKASEFNEINSKYFDSLLSSAKFE